MSNQKNILSSEVSSSSPLLSNEISQLVDDNPVLQKLIQSFSKNIYSSNALNNNGKHLIQPYSSSQPQNTILSSPLSSPSNMPTASPPESTPHPLPPFVSSPKKSKGECLIDSMRTDVLSFLNEYDSEDIYRTLETMKDTFDSHGNKITKQIFLDIFFHFVSTAFSEYNLASAEHFPHSSERRPSISNNDKLHRNEEYSLNESLLSSVLSDIFELLTTKHSVSVISWGMLIDYIAEKSNTVANQDQQNYMQLREIPVSCREIRDRIDQIICIPKLDVFLIFAAQQNTLHAYNSHFMALPSVMEPLSDNIIAVSFCEQKSILILSTDHNHLVFYRLEESKLSMIVEESFRRQRYHGNYNIGWNKRKSGESKISDLSGDRKKKNRDEEYFLRPIKTLKTKTCVQIIAFNDEATKLFLGDNQGNLRALDFSGIVQSTNSSSLREDDAEGLRTEGKHASWRPFGAVASLKSTGGSTGEGIRLAGTGRKASNSTEEAYWLWYKTRMHGFLCKNLDQHGHELVHQMGLFCLEESGKDYGNQEGRTPTTPSLRRSSVVTSGLFSYNSLMALMSDCMKGISFPYGDAITAVVCISYLNKVVSSGLDGLIRFFNMETGDCELVIPRAIDNLNSMDIGYFTSVRDFSVHDPEPSIGANFSPYGSPRIPRLTSPLPVGKSPVTSPHTGSPLFLSPRVAPLIKTPAKAEEKFLVDSLGNTFGEDARCKKGEAIVSGEYLKAVKKIIKSLQANQRKFQNDKGITCCLHLKDQKSLVFGGFSSTLLFWHSSVISIIGGGTNSEASAHSSAVAALCNVDNNYFLSCDASCNVVLWSNKTLSAVASVSFPGGKDIRTLAYSSNNQQAYVGGLCFSAFRIATMKQKPSYGNKNINTISQLTALVQNQYSNGNSLDLHRSGHLFTHASMMVTTVSEKGDIIVVADGQRVVAMERQSLTELFSFETDCVVTAILLCPSLTYLIVGKEDGVILIFNTMTVSVVREYEALGGEIICLECYEQEGVFFACSSLGQMHTFDLTNISVASSSSQQIYREEQSVLPYHAMNRVMKSNNAVDLLVNYIHNGKIPAFSSSKFKEYASIGGYSSAEGTGFNPLIESSPTGPHESNEILRKSRIARPTSLYKSIRCVHGLDSAEIVAFTISRRLNLFAFSTVNATVSVWDASKYIKLFELRIGSSVSRVVRFLDPFPILIIGANSGEILLFLVPPHPQAEKTIASHETSPYTLANNLCIGKLVNIRGSDTPPEISDIATLYINNPTASSLLSSSPSNSVVVKKSLSNVSPKTPLLSHINEGGMSMRTIPSSPSPTGGKEYTIEAVLPPLDHEDKTVYNQKGSEAERYFKLLQGYQQWERTAKLANYFHGDTFQDLQKIPNFYGKGSIKLLDLSTTTNGLSMPSSPAFSLLEKSSGNPSASPLITQKTASRAGKKPHETSTLSFITGGNLLLRTPRICLPQIDKKKKIEELMEHITMEHSQKKDFSFSSKSKIEQGNLLTVARTNGEDYTMTRASPLLKIPVQAFGESLEVSGSPEKELPTMSNPKKNTISSRALGKSLEKSREIGARNPSENLKAEGTWDPNTEAPAPIGATVTLDPSRDKKNQSLSVGVYLYVADRFGTITLWSLNRLLWIEQVGPVEVSTNWQPYKAGVSTAAENSFTGEESPVNPLINTPIAFPLLKWKAHAGNICSVQLSSSLDTILSVGEDNCLAEWSLFGDVIRRG